MPTISNFYRRQQAVTAKTFNCFKMKRQRAVGDKLAHGAQFLRVKNKRFRHRGGGFPFISKKDFPN